MQAVHLNEHDANQGAQSAGEFLGMTGNSGWYLLGSGGATILMVIFLWGLFGVSLLLCLLVGTVLCGLSVAYVFALKNNRPQHYDTDFFESALVEAGMLRFRFGPRERPPGNPVNQGMAAPGVEAQAQPAEARRARPIRRGPEGTMRPTDSAGTPVPERKAASQEGLRREETGVAREDYEQLREQLVTTEELLEEALVDRGEN